MVKFKFLTRSIAMISHVANLVDSEVRRTERKTLYVGTMPGHGYMLAPHRIVAKHAECVWHEMHRSATCDLEV